MFEVSYGKVTVKRITDFPIEKQQYWASIKGYDPKEEKRLKDNSYTTAQQHKKGMEKKLRGGW